MDLREIGCGDGKWNGVVQNGVQVCLGDGTGRGGNYFTTVCSVECEVDRRIVNLREFGKTLSWT
jgi:hypothetical protein